MSDKNSDVTSRIASMLLYADCEEPSRLAKDIVQMVTDALLSDEAIDAAMIVSGMARQVIETALAAVTGKQP